MEVQTHPTPSAFDLQSKPSFPYSLNDIRSDDFRSSEFPDPNSYRTSPLAAADPPHPHAFQMPLNPVPHAGDEPSPAPDDAVGPTRESPGLNAQRGPSSHSSAALKVQKVYRSYRTRRRLADSAVVAEELWWQAIDFVRLNHSTISFFNLPESAASRWSRVKLNASKVGKGLSIDAKAQKLAFQHWIEAIDPRHRYGHNLHYYYEEWCKTDSGQPFFFWLDLGNGKNLDLEQCPRSKLRKQCITYLGPQEREHHEYIVCEGKIIHKQSGDFLQTNGDSEGSKWIFVMSTTKKLYAGKKKKGSFHHSSFLAGGATLAAGRLEAEHGILKSISAYSGHYRPTDDTLNSFLSYLMEHGVNLDEVEIRKPNEDSDIYEDGKVSESTTTSEVSSTVETSEPGISEEAENIPSSVKDELQPVSVGDYKRTLSGGLQSPRAEVPATAILQRINSKKGSKSYQLGHKLSRKWSSGAGPRIGCVADYPVMLRQQALEMLKLSPKFPPTPSSRMRMGGLASPMACPPTPNSTRIYGE